MNTLHKKSPPLGDEPLINIRVWDTLASAGWQGPRVLSGQWKGQKLLNWASVHCPEAVGWVLRHSAISDARHVFRTQETALLWACLAHPELVRALWEGGMEHVASEPGWWTPMGKVTGSRDLLWFCTGLVRLGLESQEGLLKRPTFAEIHQPLIKTLCAWEGVHLSTTGMDGETLMTEAIRKYPLAVPVLIQAGVPVEASCSHGTPVYLACRHAPETLLPLLEAGASSEELALGLRQNPGFYDPRVHDVWGLWQARQQARALQEAIATPDATAIPRVRL